MDATALWQRYQDWLYYDEALGLYLDVSRITFDDAFVAEMTPRFEKAFESIDALEKGAIANPDENRMVGHYWLRDPDLAPNDELRSEIVNTLRDIETFTQQIHSAAITPPGEKRFTDILSIGIGGSALGPEFVAEAIGPVNPPLSISFIDNTDPDGVDKTLAKLGDRLKTTLVLVISKSGGTPETRNGMLEVKAAYEKRGLDFSKYAVATTGRGSKLDKVAKADNWLAMFPMQDWVGGRTSELSSVGLLPAALQGIDIHAILTGAKKMDAATRVPDLKNNPAALLALAWHHTGNGKGEKDMVILPYKDSLLLFSRYLQQLIMESLGKETDLDGNKVFQGIAVYGNKGSTDQHAYVQQLREGVNNFFVTLIEVLKDREGSSTEIDPGVTSGDYLSGFLLGTRKALFENNRQSITITIPEVTPTIVGALIALYERAVSLYAAVVNINAYHQPGVEAGKKAAASILNLQNMVIDVLSKTGGSLTLLEVADKVGRPDAVEDIYKIVRHLDANGRLVTIDGSIGNPSTMQVMAR
ncbi:MAG: glucose-6-phosphate isomerase [Cyanobacteria bacterium P01_D01_bin.156]